MYIISDAHTYTYTARARSGSGRRDRLSFGKLPGDPLEREREHVTRKMGLIGTNYFRGITHPGTDV